MLGSVRSVDGQDRMVLIGEVLLQTATPYVPTNFHFTLRMYVFVSYISYVCMNVRTYVRTYSRILSADF